MKLFSVQYLRGLAALLVVLTHSVLHPMSLRDPTIGRIGGVGVTLFFVISGFIMVIVSGSGPFDRWHFYLRRIQRIVPLYWFATICLAAVAVVAPSVLKTTRFEWSDLAMSLLFVPHYRASGELLPMLKLGWTLNLEIFFYFWFGLLSPLRVVGRVAALSALLCGFAIVGQVVTFTNPILASYASIHLVSFCVGMWIGIAKLAEKLPGPALKLAAAMVSGGIALMMASLFMPGQYPGPVSVLTMAAGSALMLCGGLAAEQHLFKSRAATLIGDASYSIYLVHIYFVAIAVVLWHRFAPQLPIPFVIVGAFLFGTGAGIAVHFAAEVPFMRYFSKRPKRSLGTDGDIALPDGLPPALNEGSGLAQSASVP